MSKHIGTIGSKITAEVTLINEYSFVSNFGYRPSTNYIYTMQDDEGNILVWKTTSLLGSWDATKEEYDPIYKGDKLQISGTIKEHSEYKGTPQTILARCKCSLISHKALEIAKQKQEVQMQTINEGDQILEMPYRQYKEHYSDCDTVAGSYNDHDGRYAPTIKVIIRKGRMKNSGVRGQHFSGYEFTNDEGKKVVFRAVSEENAMKQLKKEFPNTESMNWECTTIYRYR